MTNNKNFISYGYNPFIVDWQNYYQKNFLTFFEELEQLKLNLNPASKQAIDSFIETILFKLKTPAHNYLIKKDYLYSKLEQQQIKKDALTTIDINNINKKYKINPDFILQPVVFKYHNGLKLLPKPIINLIKNKTVIDCGAYYGDSALVFNNYNPKHIFAFEPSSINFNFLKETIENNNLLQKITPINKGVSDRNTFATLSFNSTKRPNLGAKVININSDINACNYNCLNHIANKSTETHTTAAKSKSLKKLEDIELITLDYFVTSNSLKDIGLIKIDIEGFELEALLGAKNTIKTYKPIILAAIYHNAEEFLKVKPFLESLTSSYNFLMCPLDTADILKEFYLIAYPK